ALPDAAAVEDAILDACGAVRRLAQVLHAVRERHPDLDLLARRVPELFARLQRWAPSGGLVLEEGESAWSDSPPENGQTLLPGLESGASADDLATAGTGSDKPQEFSVDNEKTAVAKAVSTLADEAGKADDGKADGDATADSPE